MFHRRVLLLGGVSLCLFSALVVRLGFMTLGESGVSARNDAAKRLVRETWLPTVRGTIFDRKGRVLSGDRASYDIAVDYRILKGQWVYEGRNAKLVGVDIPIYAERLARRYNGEIWDGLSEQRQVEIIDGFETALRSRVDGMYRFISERTDTPMAELFERRDQIVYRVSEMKAEYTQRTRARELEKYAERGDEPNDSDLARIERIASQPIVEEVEAHTLVGDVSDEIGFAFIRQSARRTPLVKIDRQDTLYNGSNAPRNSQMPTLPGLSVVDATSRIYPYRDLQVRIDRSTFPPPIRADEFVTLQVQDIGFMILGGVRPGIQANDIQRRREAINNNDELRTRSLTEKGTDRGRYFHGDRIGRSGIERAHEDHLRGLRGVSIENRQTGEATEIGSVPGRDIQLTLDMVLQARIRAILDPRLGLARVQSWHENEEEIMRVGTELDAGVIVLEVATGEILALVSTPVPPSDGDWSVYGVTNDLQKRMYDVIHTPYINRAIAMPYPPGSVAKALILAGAAKYGFYEQGKRIEATGYLLPNRPDVYRSWIWKQNEGVTHGMQLGRDPDAVDALMVSSNVFFFTLGREMGPEVVSKVYKEFGVGMPYNLGIGYEWAGSLEPFDRSVLNIDHATLMGIGQGPVTWTPLHAADAFATLARQGYEIKPKLIRDGRAPEVRDLGLPSWAVQASLEGLHEVVTNVEFGTGRAIRYPELGSEPVPIFNARGVRLWGKTGTATAPNIMFDPDRIVTQEGVTNGPQEPVLVRKGDHSWFVTLVGPEDGGPQYAIAVVVDYAGSGGRVSGPINNQIIHALIEEGYLPRVEEEQPMTNADGGRR
jgi:penicillin-binding protein 2